MDPLDTSSVSIPTTIITNDATRSSTPSFSPNSVTLVLTQQEQELFQLLVNTADAFSRGELSLPDTKDNTTLVIRIAGGWVRDTIWGRPTHDIDIAVDKLTGVQMATLVQQKQCSGKIGVIAANPDQSKHLETATMKTCGLDVDYVNLRTQEVYQDDSRIPLVQFGTPLQDAERRDFTINALFYNLHTNQVEDWTGKGMTDLCNKLLRTPLEPVKTFLDDPLRVLRAVRFAVRYNLQLCPNLRAACQLPEIRQALAVKISRERVGKELEGMLSGKGANPVKALQLIADLYLTESVFVMPRVGVDNVTSIQGRNMDSCGNGGGSADLLWQQSNELIKYCDPIMNLFTESHPGALVDTRLLPLAVYLLPFRHLYYTERTNREYLAVSYVMRQSIKFKNKDVQAMTLLMENVDKMASLISNFDTNDNRRLEAGLILRQAKEMWVTLLLLASVLLKHDIDANYSSHVYNTIVNDMKLDECWKTRPLLDGKSLMTLLELPRGPRVSVILEEQVSWMLTHSDGTREECLEHLKKYNEATSDNVEPAAKKAHVENTVKR